MYVWKFLKPALVLFVGGEIVENDMELAIPKGGDDAEQSPWRAD